MKPFGSIAVISVSQVCLRGDGSPAQVSLSHGVPAVPAAVRAAARPPGEAAAALRPPAAGGVSVRLVRLPVATLGEEPHEAGRLLLRQGQRSRAPCAGRRVTPVCEAAPVGAELSWLGP